MFLVHRRDVIEPVEIGNRLKVGLVLDQLLSAAVEQPDVGIDAGDDFAVQIKNQAQHTMRGRMLGSEIDRQVGFFSGAVAGLGRNILKRDLLGHGFFPGSPEAAPGAMTAFSSPGRMCGAPSHGLMKSKSRNS